VIAETLHVALPVAAFLGAIYAERYKAHILSHIAFWDKDHTLEGTYVASWTVDAPPGTAAPAQAPPSPFDDYVEIEWAAGGYAIGEGVNAKYGKYVFAGKRTDGALTLTYRAKDKAYSTHIGVILLTVQADGSLAGTWSQNRPDLKRPEGGSTHWKKRPK
jgi:hypothetical protein